MENILQGNKMKKDVNTIVTVMVADPVELVTPSSLHLVFMGT